MSSPSSAGNADSDASAAEVEETTLINSVAASSPAPKLATEHTAEATPTESDLIPYDEA